MARNSKKKSYYIVEQERAEMSRNYEKKTYIVQQERTGIGRNNEKMSCYTTGKSRNRQEWGEKKIYRVKE